MAVPLAGATTGCPLSCSNAGCFNNLAVKLLPAGGSWAGGTYQVDIVADGTPSQCTFTIDAARPGTVIVACSGAFDVNVPGACGPLEAGVGPEGGGAGGAGGDADMAAQADADADTDAAGSVDAQSTALLCTDVANLGRDASAPITENQFTVTLQIDDATPAQVSLTISRDGQTIANDTITPQYKSTQPNGPNCEPTCNFATSTLTIPG